MRVKDLYNSLHDYVSVFVFMFLRTVKLKIFAQVLKLKWLAEFHAATASV